MGVGGGWSRGHIGHIASLAWRVSKGSQQRSTAETKPNNWFVFTEQAALKWGRLKEMFHFTKKRLKQKTN